MDLGQKGVFCFTDALTPTQLVELAQRTEELGYAALWYPEVVSYESFGLGGFLLAHTKKLIIASGIANIYARDAAATKQAQHTLAKLYGGRFLLGLGVSHVPLVKDARGHEYRPRVAHASLSGGYGQGRGDCAATRRTSTNSAGGVRPPDDRPSWTADFRCLSL